SSDLRSPLQYLLSQLHCTKVSYIWLFFYYTIIWTYSSCNIRGQYVARELRLATSGGNMLHVSFVLQHPGAICCTWALSCNFREVTIFILSIRKITFLLFINTKIKKDLSVGFHLMDKSF